MNFFGQDSIDSNLLEALKNARHICVLTGAGISAESGIPTFRDSQTGLWAKYNPEELASPEGFARNPALVWEWYAWRREIATKAMPNPGHIALARLDRLSPRVDIITQNVDGLHQQAGSQNVIEIHGNIHRIRCSKENIQVTGYLESEKPPRCPRCHAYLRPDVVWFGESLPQDMLERAMNVCSECDILFSIGTSGLVYPAASLPFLALDRGAVVVEINPVPTTLSSQATYTIQGRSGEVLPLLIEAAWPNLHDHKQV